MKPAIPAGQAHWWPRFPAGMAVLLGIAILLFASFWLLDTTYFGRRTSPGFPGTPWRLLLEFDTETLQNALSSLAQVVVAVLGIAITVVSIVVQLAATRYTPRIAEMFFRDKKNLIIMGFFVVACIDAVWVSIVVTGGFLPRATVIMTTVVVTASLLLLLPYFAYVFAFLDPEKVITRIGHQVLDSVLAQRTARHHQDDLGLRQQGCVSGLEHLCDIAVNTVAQRDKIIATRAVTALRDFAISYLATKDSLPPDWFVVGPRIVGDPDFIALAPDSLQALVSKHIWVEWKLLRHFRSVFLEGLQHLPELSHVVGIETRYIAEEALARCDREVMVIAIRFFNSYVRSALNQKNVRACYNIFHQYRLLAERLLRQDHADLVLEIGRCFAYYGQRARQTSLDFVTETAAHDLAELCEHAFTIDASCHDNLLGIFLEVDKEAETQTENQTLRGVRKAQVKLATYYLTRGRLAHADRIGAELRAEKPERLASIINELLAVTEREFWEVTDRGVNFDYLDDTRKEKLDELFARIALR